MDIKNNQVKDRNDEQRELFQFIQDNGIDVSLEEVIESCEQLRENSYVVLDDFLLYNEKCSLEDFIEEEMEERLEDQKEVNRLFSKEELINMWINEADKYDAIIDIIRDKSLQEIFQAQPRLAYTTIYGNKVMYMKLYEDRGENLNEHC